MELDSFLSSLQQYGTVCISSGTAPLKTAALSAMVNKTLQEKKQVHYMDFDLQYTALLSNDQSFEEQTRQGLNVLRSGEHSTTDVFVKLLNFRELEQRGLVILDSVNTLQTLLQEKDGPIDYLNANHKAAVLITLAQQFVDLHQKVLILASVIRSRPRGVQRSEIWEKELSGGRMLKFKSDALVSISYNTEDTSSKRNRLNLTVESVAERSSQTLKQGQCFLLDLRAFM